MAEVIDIAKLSSRAKRGKAVFVVAWKWVHLRVPHEAQEAIAADDELAALSFAMQRLRDARQDEQATPVVLQPHQEFSKLAWMKQMR